MIDISARGVSKRYAKPSSQHARRRAFGFLSPKETFLALKDVSFEVGTGEGLGVIGPNGSGKTTLIKLLSSITAPTTGEIVLRGRLSSLVEVGAGFHPDLSGRENIYLNGAILGMSRAEISRKIRRIIDFSELGDFIDAPVKTYSSGMYVRLGFSIAIHLDSEILLLDEVLAVGDVAFQARCFDRIDEVRRAGRTVVLVSHDMAAIDRICDRAILLHSGEIAAMGPPRSVIEDYETLAFSALRSQSGTDAAPAPITLEALAFAGPNGGMPRTGDLLTCRLRYAAREAMDQIVCTLSFIWPSGYLCTQMVASDLHIEPGFGEILFTCPVLTMQRGLYTVDVSFERAGTLLDHRSRCALFRVDVGKIVAGDFYLPHSARVQHGAGV